MERKTNDLLEQAIKIMGEDADIMIVAHKDGQCGAVVHGSVENAAMAIFSCIHQEDDRVGQAIYGILKLNVMNLLGNPTPYGKDLIDSIEDMVDEMAEKARLEGN